MKTKRRAASWVALVIAAVLLTSCPNPAASSKGSGSLTIQVTNNVNAKTLLPSLDMNAASFTVSGTGPNGATFSQTTSGGTVMVNSLAFGDWSVTVDALNAAGTIIGSGQAAATVHTGETTTVAISVVPLTGNGTLSLSVNWTASQVGTPSIQASLTPPSGPATTLSFSISGNQATCSSTTIPAGYQTLTLQLLDNNLPVMGAVEVVRIVAGQTTSGTYTFANVNQPGGTLQVNITPALANPIPVSIGGVGSTITAGTSMTAIASVSDGTANVIYVWYLNGVSQATGSSYTFGSTLAAGYYRLDVTGYTADGTRAGSGTASFQVTGAAGSAEFHLYVTIDNAAAVSAFAVGSNGSLAPLSTPSFASGSFPAGIAATPNGSFLYVANIGSRNVTGYAIGSGGLLAPLSTTSFATGVFPERIAVAPNGSFLYVATDAGSATNYSGAICAYAVGPSGLLSPLSTPIVATGLEPQGIVITPNGSFLYVASMLSNTLSGYAIGPDGLLTPLSTPTFAAGGNPWKVAVTPNGSFLYVTNDNATGAVSGYAIGAGGLLTPLSTPAFATGAAPAGIAITPNGSFLYVVSDNDNTVSAYAIGSDGLLAPLSTPTFATGSAPLGIAITPDGSFLYVTNLGSNTLSGYSIGPNGLLTPLSTPTFATGASPFEMVVVP